MRMMLEIKTILPGRELQTELDRLCEKYHLQMADNFLPVPMGKESCIYTLDGPESIDLNELRNDPNVVGVYPDLVVAPFFDSS